MRWTHLRGGVTFQSDCPFTPGAFILGLVFRSLFKVGTSRGFQGSLSPELGAACAVITVWATVAGM